MASSSTTPEHLNPMATRRGTARDDTLDGTSTADVLLGLAGDDRLAGGPGADLLDGGSGADRMAGGRDDDTYIVDHAADRVVERAGEGHDRVRTSVAFTLPPHVEDAILLGARNISLTGNAHANRLLGNAGNNRLSGGGGDDRLDGGRGDDVLAGGAGDDFYVVDADGDLVLELRDAGYDTVRSTVTFRLPDGVEALQLTGANAINGYGNDTDNVLTGNAANNHLDGSGGDDWLDGQAGADILRGGSGNDTLVVDDVGDVVIEFAQSEVLRLAFDDGAGGATFLNPGVLIQDPVIAQVGSWTTRDSGTLEPNGLNGFGDPNRGKAIGATSWHDGNAFVFSIDLADDVLFELNALSFKEQGSNGARGNGPSDWVLTLNGVEIATGAATLGTPGVHSIDLARNDLTGTLTFELAAHGASASTATWRIDDFSLVGTVGGGGIDTVRASISYTLPDGVENLVLIGDAVAGTGNSFANDLTGNAAANVLDGGAGVDRLLGLGGDDQLVFDAQDELVDGGEGIDSLVLMGDLDLRGRAGVSLLALERLELAAGAAQAVMLTRSDVLALAGEGLTLRIDGASGDSVTSTGQEWVLTSTTALSLNGTEYWSYAAQGATLLLATVLTLDIS
jgi:Ca2+-binding RTX toxin-like protein